jgi:hypothetical protein
MEEWDGNADVAPKISFKRTFDAMGKARQMVEAVQPEVKLMSAVPLTRALTTQDIVPSRTLAGFVQ